MELVKSVHLREEIKQVCFLGFLDKQLYDLCTLPLNEAFHVWAGSAAAACLHNPFSEGTFPLPSGSCVGQRRVSGARRSRTWEGGDPLPVTVPMHVQCGYCRVPCTSTGAFLLCVRSICKPIICQTRGRMESSLLLFLVTYSPGRSSAPPPCTHNTATRLHHGLRPPWFSHVPRLNGRSPWRCRQSFAAPSPDLPNRWSVTSSPTSLRRQHSYPLLS